MFDRAVRLRLQQSRRNSFTHYTSLIVQLMVRTCCFTNQHDFAVRTVGLSKSVYQASDRHEGYAHNNIHGSQQIPLKVSRLFAVEELDQVSAAQVRFSKTRKTAPPPTLPRLAPV